MQIVSADQPGDLPHLIGLRLAMGLLKVDHLGDTRSDEYLMAAPTPDLDKSQTVQQVDQVNERNVTEVPMKDPLKKTGGVHLCNVWIGDCTVPCTR